MRPDPSNQFEWKRRRRIIHGALIFCATLVSIIAAIGGDTDLNRTIVTSCFALATLIISTYVLGATWDDLNTRKYSQHPAPSEHGGE